MNLEDEMNNFMENNDIDTLEASKISEEFIQEIMDFIKNVDKNEATKATIEGVIDSKDTPNEKVAYLTYDCFRGINEDLFSEDKLELINNMPELMPYLMTHIGNAVNIAFRAGQLEP